MSRNSKRLTPDQRGVLRQALVAKRAELLRSTGCFGHDRADIEVDSAELEDIAERLQAVPWARYAVEEAKWIERAFGKMGHRSTAEYPR